jgi:hypothetical protein
MTRRRNEDGTAVELARRAADGLDVALLWDRRGDRLTVSVQDDRSGACFSLGAADGKEALDAFYHPFAYAAARGVEAVSAVPAPP